MMKVIPETRRVPLQLLSTLLLHNV